MKHDSDLKHELLATGPLIMFVFSCVCVFNFAWKAVCLKVDAQQWFKIRALLRQKHRLQLEK